jgi:hypothetical protein
LWNHYKVVVPMIVLSNEYHAGTAEGWQALSDLISSKSGRFAGEPAKFGLGLAIREYLIGVY